MYTKGKCKAGLTAAFNEILHNVERIGNSCVNLADAAEDGVRFSTFFKRDGVENFYYEQANFQ